MKKRVTQLIQEGGQRQSVTREFQKERTRTDGIDKTTKGGGQATDVLKPGEYKAAWI